MVEKPRKKETAKEAVARIEKEEQQRALAKLKEGGYILDETDISVYADTVTKAKEIYDTPVAKALDMAKSLKGYAGFVLYVYNEEKMISELRPLREITPVVKSNKTGEYFLLTKPAFSLNGKPTFICVRGYPASIDLVMSNVANMKALLPDENDAASIGAQLDSLYANVLFRQKMLSGVYIGVIILLCIVSASIALLMATAYYNPWHVATAVSNSTETAIRALGGLIHA